MLYKEYIRFIGYVDIVHQEGSNWVCYEWLGKKDSHGYGRFWYRGQWRQAHRISYSWISRRWRLRATEDEIAEGMHINHKCCNRACVRKSHLEEVTPKENHEYRSMVYWRNKRKTIGGKK